MSLPEPAQSIPGQGQKKETITVPAAPASTVPVVEDAGQFVSPTVPNEVAHVVAPTSPMPVVSMPPEVTHAGEGVPVATGQEAEIPPAKTPLPFKPYFGKLGIGLGGWVKDSRNWRAVQAKRKKEREALSKAA